jgi:flagellar motility protein MotE (MotC chaperone)
MSKKKGIIFLVAMLVVSCSLTVGIRVATRKAPPHRLNAKNTEASTQPSTQPTTSLPQVPALATEHQVDNLVKDLQVRLEDVRKRQLELDQREKRIRISQELLIKQAQELEALRMEMVAPLTSLKEARAVLAKEQLAVTELEKANLKRTAQIYEKMDAESSGRILSGMCESNQEDDAAKILHFMSDRSAGKLLATLDSKLAARLCDKLKKIKETSGT